MSHRTRTENDLGLGELITGPAERDAIHVAVIPLTAGETLWTGSCVKLAAGFKDVAVHCRRHEAEYIGVVDPFLSLASVSKGNRFWCFLCPGTVTGMRHHWQHPHFDSVSEKPTNEHKDWILKFCGKWNFSYSELIQAATGRKYGAPMDAEDRYVIARGISLHDREALGEDYDLFWSHLEALTGQIFDKTHREGIVWSCSC